MVRTWKDLEVWQKAHALVLKVYKWAAMFPQEKRLRLVYQLCRSAISVPANIGEGQAYRSTYAGGSIEETRYQLLLVQDPGGLRTKEYCELEAECE